MSRPESCAPLYDYIGTHYDITRRADPYLVERLIQHSVRSLKVRRQPLQW